MSNSRLEKFIYAICSMEVSDLPAPLSRIEILWNCLITGETPDFEPQSRNEQYLMAMLGLYDLNQLPTPMSRGEKLLYKIAMGETDLSDIPAYLSRYEELLGYLAENGGVGDFEYILQTLNQRLSMLYSTKERPMKQAVIKGDTLVNELPRPSLKNTMTNVESQKLNHGYDTVNAVDGEFKSAILKGNTLVNCLKPQIGYYSDYQITSTYEDFTLFKPNTLYTFINNWDKGGTLAIRSNNGQITNVNFAKNSSTLFTTPSAITNIEIYSPNGIHGGTPSDCEKWKTAFIVIEGDYTNVDIPYFEGMQSVKLPVLTTTGKNLFDGKNMSFGWVTTDGNISVDDTSNSLSDYIKVEPSTSYAYNCFVDGQSSIYGEFAFYDENKNFINILYEHHGSDTCIITPDNCHYLRAWNNQYKNNGDTHPNAMLVKTTDLPSTLIYEPYQSNILTVNEPVTLRKVGDVEDEFDALTGQVTERVGEVVLDGSEQWYLGTTKELTQVFGLEVRDMAFIDNMIKCDKLPVNASGDAEKVTTWFKSNSERYTYCLYIALLKTKVSTVDGLKSYLSQNPITVQYQLKTPTNKTVNTTITDQDGVTQTKLHSFNDGYLSVSSQGLLPSAVDYEVPTNNSYYLPDMLTLGAQYTSRGSADCNATIDGKLLALGKNRTFTIPSSVTDRLMVLDAPVDDLMFIKGDQTAKDFGYFEGMKSVGLSNKMPVLTTTGKNLFNRIMLDNKTISSTGDIVNNTSFAISEKINVKSNAAIIYSNQYSYYGISIHEFGDGDVYIKKTDVNRANQPITTSDKTTYVIFLIYKDEQSGGISLENFSKNAMLEEGTIATAYEPYKSNILTVNEDVELRGVGDVKDELDCLTGQVTERIGEVVLDGSENWRVVGGDKFYTNVVSTSIKKDSRKNIILSDKFRSDSWVNVFANTLNIYDVFGVHDNGNIEIRKQDITTVEEWKTLLTSNPITVQYQLATESIKTVDLTVVDQDNQPTKLGTFENVTHVSLESAGLIPEVEMEVATRISKELASASPLMDDISTNQQQLEITVDEQSNNVDATMIATTEIYEGTL